MSAPPPLLFHDKTQDLLTKIEKELRGPAGLGWRGHQGGAGQAMVSLFGRFADIIVARLNQVPRQHFLTFLSEGGIDQLPPRAATTRLVFVPENDARPAIPVPAGTQVATRAAGGKPEIIFETAHDIQVIPTELKWCIALDQRTSASRSKRANGQEPGAFAAFHGENVRERVLFVRDDALLTFPDAKTRENATVTLHFELDPGVQLAGEWQLAWSYFNGKEWALLTEAGAQVADETGRLMHNGDVRLTRLPELAATEVNGDKGLWIACRLAPISENVTLPRIKDITIHREIVISRQKVTPQVLTATQAGAAFAPVKAEDAFYPFGQFPALLDGLYIQAGEAFTKPGATIELQFEEDGLPAGVADTSMLEALTIQWEYFSTKGWTSLGASRWGSPEMVFAGADNPLVKSVSVRAKRAGRQLMIELPPDYEGEEPPPGFPPGRLDVMGDKPVFITDVPQARADLPDQIIARGRSYTSERLGFRDTTCAFTTKGTGGVSFTVPTPESGDPPFAPTEVNGQTGYWVRATIEKAGYSVPQSGSSGLLRKLLVGKVPAPPPAAIPPLVRSFEASYADYRSVEGPCALQKCLGKTDGGWRSPVAGQGFAPFSTRVEHQALYMGFLPLDADPAKGKVAFPANKWIEIYLGVEETDEQRTAEELVWQYWNGKDWQKLGIVDETFDLSRSGMVGFFGPADHKPSTEFGQAAYWLRVCSSEFVAHDARNGVEAGGTDEAAAVQGAAMQDAAMPRITAIRLNTVPCYNGESINEEVLGSSTGEKNQVRVLSHAPVLPDAEIEVWELDGKTEAAEPTWTRWRRVSSLHSCGPADRCYTLDPNSGTVTFGDGEDGMIPPAGQNNIRAKRYRTHNGQNGNVAAGAVIVLRTPRDALNELRRVENVEPAAGGADLEETAQAELRGPYSLKNRGRAITREDFEWLAREVAGVRRVFCVPGYKADGTRQPGWVTVVVVPEPTHTASNAAGRPMPAPSLLRLVREYLEARGLISLARSTGDIGDEVTAQATSDPDQIQVTGPRFVEVEVVADVVAKNPEQADSVRTDILKQLRTFLDPLDGGPDRQGWELGRDVYISEIKAEIERVPGVDHVKSAYLRTPGRQLQLLTSDGKTKLPAEMPRGSIVSTFDGRIMAVLADALPMGASVQDVRAAGFNEGDFATIRGLQGHTLPFTRRVSVQHDNPARIIFDQPIDFSDKSEFDRWQSELGDEPTLVSANHRVRAPIPIRLFTTQTDDTGRVHLLGVEVRGFVAGEPITIIHAKNLNRRADFLPVQAASPIGQNPEEVKLLVVFVSDGHLVFTGYHEITMVV